VAIAARAPDEVARPALALAIDVPFFKHIGRFELGVRVERYVRTRHHADQDR